jgi:ribonuclease T1
MTYKPLSNLLCVLAFFIGTTAFSCQDGKSAHSQIQSQTSKQSQNPYQSRKVKEQSKKSLDKYHARPKEKINRQRFDYQTAKASQGIVPAKAFKVFAYVQQTNRAPDGYVGGRRFGNFEGHLPRQDLEGRRIDYQEWDVNPRVNGRNRGAERLVTGSDGRAWYTSDHYNSFIQIKK